MFTLLKLYIYNCIGKFVCIVVILTLCIDYNCVPPLISKLLLYNCNLQLYSLIEKRVTPLCLGVRTDREYTGDFYIKDLSSV